MDQTGLRPSTGLEMWDLKTLKSLLLLLFAFWRQNWPVERIKWKKERKKWTWLETVFTGARQAIKEKKYISKKTKSNVGKMWQKNPKMWIDQVEKYELERARE